MNEWIIVALILVIPLICGVVTMRVAASKGRDTGGEKTGWFLLGFFFPVIGLIVSLVISPKAGATSSPRE